MKNHLYLASFIWKVSNSPNRTYIVAVYRRYCRVQDSRFFPIRISTLQVDDNKRAIKMEYRGIYNYF